MAFRHIDSFGSSDQYLDSGRETKAAAAARIQPTDVRRRVRLDVRLWTVASAVAEVGLTVGYAALTLEWVRAPGSGLARATKPWRDLLGRALRPVVEAFGGPPCHPTGATALHR